MGLMIVLVLCGCARTSAPPQWLPVPEQAQRESYGAWIAIQYRDEGRQEQKLQGELIAVHADSVYVLQRSGFSVVAKDRILRARLTAFDAQTRQLGAWTGLGAASTVSHGLGLIFSMPIWLLVGCQLTAHQSHQPILDYPDADWEELRPFARFPQGLPQPFAPNLLRGKPYDWTRVREMGPPNRPDHPR
jgi:hypothetical protein